MQGAWLREAFFARRRFGRVPQQRLMPAVPAVHSQDARRSAERAHSASRSESVSCSEASDPAVPAAALARRSLRDRGGRPAPPLLQLGARPSRAGFHTRTRALMNLRGT